MVRDIKVMLGLQAINLYNSLLALPGSQQPGLPVGGTPRRAQKLSAESWRITPKTIPFSAEMEQP